MYITKKNKKYKYKFFNQKNIKNITIFDNKSNNIDDRDTIIDS